MPRQQLGFATAGTSRFFGERAVGVEWTDFPLVQNYIKRKVAEHAQNLLLRQLRIRFGNVPEVLAAIVRTVTEENELEELLDQAIWCSSLQAFQERLVVPT